MLEVITTKSHMSPNREFSQTTGGRTKKEGRFKTIWS